jgi:hypothetical protein
LGGTGAGSVTISSGATLAGTGTVTGTTTVSGVLAPGDSFGTGMASLNFGGDLTVDSVGLIQLQIQSPVYVANTGIDFGTTSVFDFLNSTDSATRALWNAVPATGSDFLNVTGGLSVSGGITVLSSGYTAPAFGDVFNLMDWGGITGGTSNSTAFTGHDVFSLTLPDLSAFTGLSWDTSAFTTYGIIVVVPEPGRILLMILGLMALFIRRRR